MSRFSGITSAIMLLAAAACRGQPGLEQVAPVYVDTVRVEVSVADPEALSAAFCEIASSAGPSVVTITSRSVVKAVVPGFQTIPSPFGFDPWGGGFRFPGFEEREYVREGLGSGVIIDSKGYIVTNNHVVAGADELEVILADGARFPASLVGTDPRTDLAVIRIEAGDTPLQAIRQGDASSLRVGQIVLAVGSPFALSSSVTQGIISFIGRTGVGLADYEDFIQTDAAINPGNSGGPLVDVEGRMVGINAVIQTGGPYAQGNIGIGFAVPVNLAMRVADSLMANGRMERPWIGVQLREQEDAPSADARGVVVGEVFENSPAARCGLREGDLITKVDGEPVHSVRAVQRMVFRRRAGEPARFDVRRGQRAMEFEVVTETMPDFASSPD